MHISLRSALTTGIATVTASAVVLAPAIQPLPAHEPVAPRVVSTQAWLPTVGSTYLEDVAAWAQSVLLPSAGASFPTPIPNEAVQVTGINDSIKNIYNAIEPWVEWGFDVAAYVVGWIPWVGWFAPQISILYDFGEAIVRSVVFNGSDWLFGPLPFGQKVRNIAGDVWDASWQLLWDEIGWVIPGIPLPPLPPCPAFLCGRAVGDTVLTASGEWLRDGSLRIWDLWDRPIKGWVDGGVGFGNDIFGALNWLRAALNGEAQDPGASVNGEVAILGASLNGDVTELRSAVREDIANLRAALNGGMANLPAGLEEGVATLRATLKEDIANLRAALRGDVIMGTATIDSQTDTTGEELQLASGNESVNGVAAGADQSPTGPDKSGHRFGRGERFHHVRGLVGRGEAAAKGPRSTKDAVIPPAEEQSASKDHAGATGGEAQPEAPARGDKLRLGRFGDANRADHVKKNDAPARGEHGGKASGQQSASSGKPGASSGKPGASSGKPGASSGKPHRSSAAPSGPSARRSADSADNYSAVKGDKGDRKG